MTRGASFDLAVDHVAELLNREIGLRPEPTLRGRLERCIREDAAGAECDVDAYVSNLTGRGNALQSLVNRVTVQETAFFRHPEHFALLADDVLRGLDEPVTIWSAACSNGQEAYSVAMLLEEIGIEGSVIATDLSTTALERTGDARYTERELAGLSPQRIARHFERCKDGYRITRHLRARVTVSQHNLLDPIPTQVRDCRVVLCRNVLIYFSPEHGRAFLDRLVAALPEARLFLGAAETIWQLSDRYDTVRTGDTFSYRRRPTIALSDALDVRAVTPPRAWPSLTGTRRAGTARPVPMRPVPTRPVPIRPSPTRPVPAAAARTEDDPSVFAALHSVGQRASAAGEIALAVVAFRKCAYLAPHDPMAHLNLGLALEAAGDHQSAGRAFSAARHALAHPGPAQFEYADGYTSADLIRLIDHKQRAANR